MPAICVSLSAIFRSCVKVRIIGEVCIPVAVNEVKYAIYRKANGTSAETIGRSILAARRVDTFLEH